MAKIDSFMLFDQIANSQSPDGTVVAQFVNPQPVLRPQFIPGNYSFAYCLAIRDVDFSKENTMGVRIEDPNGITIDKKEGIKTPINHIRDNIPEEYCGFVINANMHNFALKKAGIYHLVVSFNGSDLDFREIPVFLRDGKHE